MNDKIEELLRHKPAAQLDEAERAAVLEAMSLSEYDRLHRALIALRQTDANAAPSPGLRESLLAQGRSQGYFQSPRNSWWNHQIPVWQTVAALLIFMAASYLFYENKSVSVQEKWMEKIVFQRDTIFKTDTLWREKVVIRYRKAVVPALPAGTPDTLRKEASPQAMNIPAGTSIGDMPALMEFLGVANN